MGEELPRASDDVRLVRRDDQILDVARQRVVSSATPVLREPERECTPESALAPVGPSARSPLRGWLTGKIDRAMALLSDLSARRSAAIAAGPGTLVRSGGVVARWLAFPRGVQAATAALTAGTAGTLLALAAGDPFFTGAAIACSAWLTGAAGPIGVRMARRLHRLMARQRIYRIAELRTVPDRKLVAVRGVVVPRRLAASALDGRPAVWSLARFDSWSAAGMFHELAFDFLLDDGSDEPVLVEVEGGMVLEAFPPDRRVKFQSTTLLDIAHPYLTKLRLRGKEVRASEINVFPGDVVEVVGRLSHAVDPTATAGNDRAPPQRRSLRSGMRVPLMVRRVKEPALGLARVRRLMPKGPPEVSPGEPPVRRF